MRFGARVASCLAALTVAIVTWPAGAQAELAEGGLGLQIKAAESYSRGEEVRLTFAVTNAGAGGCGLAKSTAATVQVTSVKRDGQELFPVLSRSFYGDGLAGAVKAATVTAEPTSTVELTMPGLRIHDDADADSVVLRSVAMAPDGGGLDSLWPIGVPGRYEVTASYAMPELEGVAVCPGGTEAKTVTFTVGDAKQGTSWVWLAVGAGVVVLLIGLLVILMVRRKRPAAAAVMVLLAFAALGGGHTKPAYADYEVDPTKGLPVSGVDFKAEVEACFAKFSAPGGDPAGVMGRLKDPKTPKVRIIPTTGGSDTFETPKSPAGKGSSTITWNPINTENYENDVARDPCAALYHELNHADDISKEQVPEGMCGDTGIKTAEVKATLAENRYRKAKGLPPRTRYLGKKLPKSLDECKKKPGPPPKGPVKLCEGAAGQNQCGGSNGDPHLVTFDRAYYDLQAVGEFVVVKSTAGDPLEIQARQAPFGSSRTVSINSAVGFLVGTQKIEMVIVNGVTQVRLGGETLVLAQGDKSLPGGGVLTRRDSDTSSEDGYEVRWPDGSAAAVDQIGTYGYRLLARLATGRAAKVQGLLGNFDGDPGNDIAPRDGRPLTQPVPFDKLYPAYADSWRVTQSNSLFSYAPGQSTETFTDRKYPEKAFTVNDIDPERRAQAEAICRWAGVTDPWQFLECVFDVAVTGRPEFAVGSVGSERAARPEAAPIGATPVVSGTLVAGSTDRLTFAGKAGQAIFVDAFAPTMPDRCSPYRLLDPAGATLNSGCNINGIGHIDRTDLKADGQYSVVIDPAAVTTGKASIRVYAAKDIAGTIEPNGPELSPVLEQPGSVARYQFAGRGGERVYLEVTNSDLPDQCAPLQLRGPSGTVMMTGCVINGHGDLEGTVLPADGTYTVIVDPNDRAIGSVHMRLFSARDQMGTISLNGPTVTNTISQPGAYSAYRFDGTAGMTITVEATDSTLPDECSPLGLLDPAGKEIYSGCVINGTGDMENVTLPVSGSYLIVVDPAGSGIGTTTLRLLQK